MSEAPTDPNARRTLLVVDDQPNVRSSVAHYLEFCGYRTLRAESGLAAIELTQSQEIDGVLLDVHMPGLSGFDTCIRLLAAAREAGKPMKVWFMTGAFSRGMDEICQQVGGLAIFRKPFDWPELLAEVERGLLPPPMLPENKDVARYYLRSLFRNGALATARRMLQPKRLGKVDKGLQKLIDAGLAKELSVEAKVLRPEVVELFTAAELAEARKRLDLLPGPKPEPIAPADNFADTVPGGKGYPEGAVKTVVVNRYERNAKAREECIKHHGAACTICKIDFGETYGEIGKDFIHVHHLRELSTIGVRYEVDPIKDLIPVCPNCHSMIHSTRPARSLDEVRAAFWEKKG